MTFSPLCVPFLAFAFPWFFPPTKPGKASLQFLFFSRPGVTGAASYHSVRYNECCGKA